MPSRLTPLSFAAALLPLLIFGCAKPPEALRPDAKAIADTDEFSGSIAVIGPEMDEGDKIFDWSYYLVTQVDKQTGRYYHYIGTHVYYQGGFVNFDYVADDQAHPLQVQPKGHTTGYVCVACFRSEHFNVLIPDAVLRARVATGYRVKASTKGGDAFIMTLTPKMIGLQYEKLAQVVATIAPPSAPPPTSAVATGAAPPDAPQAPKRAPPKPGIGLQMLPKSTAEMTHGNMRGAVILAVTPDSPAAAAGIHGGDLIVKIDGHAVDSGDDVQDVLAKIKPNNSVKVDILRGATALTVTLKL